MKRARLVSLAAALAGVAACGRGAAAAPAAGGTLVIESAPPAARVFIRTGGLNGYAEVGRTPLTLNNVEPGLLEYSLLADGRQMHDGSLWVEAGRTHREAAELEAGRIFHVDAAHPAASDAAAGSAATPWKSIRHAADVLEAGDTVLIRKGTYLEHWDRWKEGMWATPNLAPRNSGQPGRPIVFRAFPGEDVLVTGDQGAGLGGGREHIRWIGLRTDRTIMLYGAKHCALIDVERIGEFRPTNDNHDGVRIERAENIVLRNCLIRDVRGLGWNSAGIKCYNVRRLLVDHCDIWNCHSCVFDKEGGQFNIYRYSILRDLQTDPKPGGPIFQMYTQGQSPTDGCELYCNLLLGGGIYYNTSARTTPFRVHDNTFVGGGVGSKGRRMLVMFNNIFQSGEGGRDQESGGYRLVNSPELPASDHNAFWPAADVRFAVYTPDERRYRGLDEWRKAKGLEPNSIEADPLFENAPERRFVLKAGSPCIDRGRPFTRATGGGRDRDTIAVGYAWSFSDGHGVLAKGDTIQIGRGRAAQLAAVVKVIDEMQLQLDRKVSWQDGDWVSLPFQGEAPDIGACEHGDTRLILGPTWRAYPRRALAGQAGRPFMPIREP